MPGSRKHVFCCSSCAADGNAMCQHCLCSYCDPKLCKKTRYKDSHYCRVCKTSRQTNAEGKIVGCGRPEDWPLYRNLDHPRNINLVCKVVKPNRPLVEYQATHAQGRLPGTPKSAYELAAVMMPGGVPGMMKPSLISPLGIMGHPGMAYEPGHVPVTVGAMMAGPPPSVMAAAGMQPQVMGYGAPPSMDMGGQGMMTTAALAQYHKNMYAAYSSPGPYFTQQGVPVLAGPPPAGMVPAHYSAMPPGAMPGPAPPGFPAGIPCAPSGADMQRYNDIMQMQRRAQEASAAQSAELYRQGFNYASTYNPYAPSGMVAPPGAPPPGAVPGVPVPVVMQAPYMGAGGPARDVVGVDSRSHQFQVAPSVSATAAVLASAAAAAPSTAVPTPHAVVGTGKAVLSPPEGADSGSAPNFSALAAFSSTNGQLHLSIPPGPSAQCLTGALTPPTPDTDPDAADPAAAGGVAGHLPNFLVAEFLGQEREVKQEVSQGSDVAGILEPINSPAAVDPLAAPTSLQASQTATDKNQYLVKSPAGSANRASSWEDSESLPTHLVEMFEANYGLQESSAAWASVGSTVTTGSLQINPAPKASAPLDLKINAADSFTLFHEPPAEEAADPVVLKKAKLEE